MLAFSAPRRLEAERTAPERLEIRLCPALICSRSRDVLAARATPARAGSIAIATQPAEKASRTQTALIDELRRLSIAVWSPDRDTPKIACVLLQLDPRGRQRNRERSQASRRGAL